MWIAIGVVAFLGLLAIILVVRTFRFKPEARLRPEPIDINLDEKRIIASLQAMIRYKTISHLDKQKEDREAFASFREYLRTRYPLINARARYEEIGETGVLFTLKGESNDKPIVLMSHYDVVPENGEWEHDPFSGMLIDDAIYGRGTLDTKGTLCSVMEAVEHWLAQKRPINHDMYLAFSGDEETRGPSANAIVEHLNKQGVKPYIVLDEGGAIVENVFPSVKKKAAMIGLAEKGYANVRLEAHSQGGHAATPPKTTPISTLAEAVVRLNKGTLFKLKKTDATMKMFDTIARHATSFPVKMIFANLWLFWPLVRYMAKKSGGEMISLLHTTQAFTQMEGSEAINVLPTKAALGVNYRILTNETVEDVKDKVTQRINNDDVTVAVVKGADPTTISQTTASYDALTDTIAQMWDGVVPVPYLMMMGTDSRYYHTISEHVYRFSPMALTKTDRASIHSTEEKIKTSELIHCVKFYVALLHRLHMT